jgi:hypothetical protein
MSQQLILRIVALGDNRYQASWMRPGEVQALPLASERTLLEGADAVSLYMAKLGFDAPSTARALARLGTSGSFSEKIAVLDSGGDP